MEDEFPILIAEDDENDVFIVQRALRKAGFNNPFHISRNALEVIKYLQGEEPFGDREKFRFPRLLITDLKMPGGDGFVLLEWLQQHPECSVIPRLVLTASNQEQDIQRAYKLGVNAYFVKPPNFDALVSLLRLVFQYWHLCEKPRLPPKC